MRFLFATLVAAFCAVSIAFAQPVNAPNFPAVQCNKSAVYDASTNGSTIIIANAGATRQTYVCGYSIFSGGTTTVEFDYGTGTTCATGTIKMTPAYLLTVGLHIEDTSPFFRGLFAPVSNDVCIKTNAGVAVQAVIFYGQY